MPKLVASCRTNVMDGMEVKNLTSDKAQEGRKAVTEFLLVNHPLDCPVCDQAGECHLQDLGYEHGNLQTRTEFERNTYEADDLGPNIKLNMNRCILCARCVLTANQLTNTREHGILFRGDHAEISTYLNKALDNDFIGNIIDVCPVGALTDRTSRFASRVWFTKPMNASCKCDKCSGKATVWMKGDEVSRVTARKDQWGEVEEFICDTCRFKRKSLSDWNIEGPRHIDRHSVISLNHYEKPKDELRVLDNPMAKEISEKDEK
ncbi:NADH-quinone oxidoreductase subunit G [Chryseobacterium ginsenosidimutans]|nr:NADH-quinone oxidoreductase subunit G [Chryseobacterium ginsenosidimutans]